jgi:hypothetical protein
MHTDADIPVIGKVRLRGVEADPYTEFRLRRPRRGRECALSVHGGRDRIASGIERDEEAVAGGVDLDPIMRAKRIAKKTPVLSPDLGEDISPDPAHKIRRLLDVAEEECHSAPGQRRVAHYSPIFAIQRTDFTNAAPTRCGGEAGIRIEE